MYSSGNLIASVSEGYNGAGSATGWASAQDGGGAYYMGSLSFPGACNNCTAVGVMTITGVPEPGSWALMALGFAGLGYAATRRASRKSDALAV